MKGKAEDTESFDCVAIYVMRRKNIFQNHFLYSFRRELFQSIPIDLVNFRVSLPLAAYSGSPVSSLKVFIDRIIQCTSKSGKHKQLMIYNCSTCKHTMEAFIGKGNSYVFTN